MLWNNSEEASRCGHFLLAAGERVTDVSWSSTGSGEWLESVCWIEEVGAVDW